VPNDVAPPCPDGLLGAARGGDHSAFAALVRQHEKSVYSVAWRLLNRADLAEDIAQDTFLQLYRHLDRIVSGTHLRFWLLRVATHFSLAQLRRVQPIAVAELPEIVDERDGPEASDPALMRRLQAAVATLPPVPRVVMLLRYQEDLDLAEIADVLEIPINTVKSHLRRSLHAMRAQLQDTQTPTLEMKLHD
jgi:RNA polymerase sigma-70 factor (ECF subfamily)